jgi:PAS domain S-box-containing protein
MRIGLFLGKSRFLPLLVGLVFLAMTISLWQGLELGERRYGYQILQQEVLEVKDIFSNQLRNQILPLEQMGRHWQVHRQLYGSLPEMDWAAEAQNYYNNYPGYRAIARINNQGKADWIIPSSAQLPQVPSLPALTHALTPPEKFPSKSSWQEPRAILLLEPLSPEVGKEKPKAGTLLVLIPLGSHENQDGSIVGVLDLQTLLDKACAGQISQGEKIIISVGNREVYRQGQPFSLDKYSLDKYSLDKYSTESLVFDFYGIQWQVSVALSDLFLGQTYLPRFVLIGGLCSTFGLMGLIYFAQISRRQTQQLCLLNRNLQGEIQQRQVVEDDLRKQKEILETIFNNIPVMLVLRDCQGKTLFTNKEYEQVMGWKLEDYENNLENYENNNILELMYSDPADYKMVMTHIREATGEWLDMGSINKVGETIETSWANIILSDGSRVGIGLDLTGRKQTEKLLLQRIQQKQALRRVVETIRNSWDLSQIFNIAAGEISSLLSTDRVDIVEYRPQEEIWITVAVHCLDPTSNKSPVGTRIPDEGNSLAAQLKQLKVVRLNNAAEVEDEINRDIARSFPGAWLLIPLHFQEVVWGSLSLVRNDGQNEWSEGEVEIAMSVADQLAIAIHQSLLLQKLKYLNTNLERQAYLRTLELRRALSFEATLKRITDKVRDSLDQDQILQTVVKELLEALEVDCCDTVLYSDDRLTATIAYEATQAGISSRQGQVLQTTEFPYIYQQLEKGEYTAFCQLQPSSIRNHSGILACPIVDDRGLLGDLWLFKPTLSSFGDMEIRLVEQVANQCAIAIRQAQLYQAAQAQVTELEKLNLLKDDFLKTISHELRTPITSIKLATEMLGILLQQSGILDNKLQGMEPYLGILQEESQREEKLINDLLDITSLESGTEPMSLIPLHLQYWIPYIVVPFLERTKNQQQQLSIEIPLDFPEITTDVRILERIIVELLNNACKYTPAGEVISFTTAIVSFPASNQPHIQISVGNSGVEIPAAELERIFDRFYRIPNNDPWRHSGTGLGLALVKTLVNHLGATIVVTSDPAETRFTIDLGEVSPREGVQ